MINCSYDPEIAKKYGITCALVTQRIKELLQQAKCPYKRHNGYVRMTAKELAEEMQFLNGSKAYKILVKCCKVGLLHNANLSDDPFDKGIWYGVTTKY